MPEKYPPPTITRGRGYSSFTPPLGFAEKYFSVNFLNLNKMKNFQDSKAFALLNKSVADEATRAFFIPVEKENYSIQPETKKVKIKDKTYERLVLLAQSTGVEHLVDPRSLTQIAFDDNLQVIQGGQTLAEVLKIIETHDFITFEFGDDCLLLGKKVEADYLPQGDEKVFLANSGQKFLMRAGKIRKVVGISE